MTSRVGVQFDGSAVGALTASRQAAAGIHSVRTAAAGASPALRAVEQDLGKTTRGALAGSGAFHSLGRSLAFASAGFLGAAGLASVLRGAADELVTQVKLGAQLGAVLRSTGGIAGETAGSINALAKAEAAKTGADSTQTKAAEIMLLRYSNVRRVVGEGNDIFKRATQASLDLAAALGGTAADQAATLGKALQDPYRGVTLLRRANIALTASEIENIKTLAEHGHVLQAQKALLDAVNRSYGGTAKAVGDVTPWTKLGNTLKAMSADAIRPLLPEMDGVVERAQKWADGFEKDRAAQAKLKAEIDAGISTVKGFAKGANDVAGALGGWRRTLEILLALKFASVMSGWAGAMRVFIGTEAAASGVAGASAETGLLNKRLGLLRVLAGKPFQIVISYEIYRKFIGPIVDSTSNADLLPIYKGGKWVNPVTGVAVQDQAYWNNYYKRSGGTGKPDPGQQAGGLAGTAKQRAIVQTARDLGPGHGVYVTGGTGGAVMNGPGGTVIHGFDCSGYLYEIYKKNGVDIPRTSEAQWADPNAQKIPKGSELPGDGVYFTGSPKYTPPGHCGIYIGNGKYISYYQSGKPAAVFNLADATDYWGARRWIKIDKKDGGGGAAPPKSGSTGTGTSTNVIPSRIRQAISAANVAVAAAALTPGKADDKAAIAESKASLEAEIAYLRAKLKTNLSAEKKITLEDLLTGALGDLASLGTKKPAGVGAASIVSLRASVNATLGSLPAVLDDVEQQAVSKLQQLRDHLHVGMTSKDEAQTRASIKRWGKVLKDEISKQSKIAADAATLAAALWQRGWQDDVNRVLRDFQENVIDRQLNAFDKETQAHLQGLQDRFGAQTPEEQALAAFDAAGAAADEAKQRAQIASQIADTQAQLAALTGTAPGTTDGNGTLIDIATGLRTTLAGNATAGTDIVQQRKDLLAQLSDLQDQSTALDRQDQRAALQDAADLSRRAADKQLAAAESSYQDERDAQRIALGDLLADQQTALGESLDDWNTNIGLKKKSWLDFIQWLRDNGYSTAGIVNPAATAAGAGGVALPGGITVPQGVTGGGFGGGFGSPYAPPVVTIVELNGREIVRQTSQPMSSEQARQIGYTIQRG